MRKTALTREEAIDMMSELFGPLTPEERALMEENLTLQTYKRGEVIHAEGERPQHLCCLLTGKTKTYKTGTGHRAQIIGVNRPVQYFGYRAYFAGGKYTTTAAAFERCTVARVPLTVVADVVRRNAQLAWYFVRTLSSQLEMISERTVNLTQKHIRGRLAENLLFLKNSYGLEEDNSTLSIYLSREDLACLSNMTTSNAIRTLSQFANEKIIAIDGRKIKIIDEGELAKISERG